MKVCFFSYSRCHLKVNGEYFGVVGVNPSFSEVSPDSLLEFIPFDKSLCPTYLTAKDIYYKLGDYFIYIAFFSPVRNLPFKVLFQKNIGGAFGSLQITVIQNGGITFFVDGTMIAIEELPFIPDDFKGEFIENFLYLSFYKSGKIALFVYNFMGNSPTLVFKKIVDSFDILKELKTTVLYKFVVPVSITESWEYNGEFKLSSLRTTLLENPFSINENLRPLLFFQMVSVGADVGDFLSNELKPRKFDLLEFIGSPIFITPYFLDLKKTIVINKDKASLYSLTYERGLISNIEEI